MPGLKCVTVRAEYMLYGHWSPPHAHCLAVHWICHDCLLCTDAGLFFILISEPDIVYMCFKLFNSVSLLISICVFATRILKFYANVYTLVVNV